MAGCAINGGCPTDYTAIVIAALSIIMLLWRLSVPFLVHKVPRTNGSGFWIPVIQVLGSFNLLLSTVMSVNFLKFKRAHWWQSCYLWAVWLEGPLGFGLLLSCRITQAFHLYYIFVKRRLPPVRSYIFLPLIIFPWIAAAAFINMRRPLNYRCHMGTHIVIPVVCLHTFYIAVLIGFTWTIRHIEFRFDEVKDLWKGILVSVSSIGVWIVSYILNEVHDEISWLQVASRFFLLLTASILVLAFFSISTSQPLLSQVSLSKRAPIKFETMGQALGIPDSGLILKKDPAPVIDCNEPLDKLLLNQKFRQSFMAFADSCLAGESVHFYNEVHELGKIAVDDHIRRIYMARHIIEKYIIAGAPMEVNISYRTQQEILTTTNLAHPNLFHNAINEVMQLMKTITGHRCFSSSSKKPKCAPMTTIWRKSQAGMSLLDRVLCMVLMIHSIKKMYARDLATVILIWVNKEQIFVNKSIMVQFQGVFQDASKDTSSNTSLSCWPHCFHCYNAPIVGTEEGIMVDGIHLKNNEWHVILAWFQVSYSFKMPLAYQGLFTCSMQNAILHGCGASGTEIIGSEDCS